MESNFGALDWGIIVAYLCVAAFIGYICRKMIHDMDDFVVAGRSLGLPLAVATFASTEMGLVTVMYNAEQGFLFGFSAFMLGLIAMAAVVFIGLTGFIAKPFRESRCMTVPEYYGKRFRPGVRLLGGIIAALAGILNMGVFLSFGAKFLKNVTGLPEMIASTGIPTVNVIMTALLALVLLYTILGGMFSVVFTDFIQFILTSVGLVLVVIVVLYSVSLNDMADAIPKAQRKSEPLAKPVKAAALAKKAANGNRAAKEDLAEIHLNEEEKRTLALIETLESRTKQGDKDAEKTLNDITMWGKVKAGFNPFVSYGWPFLLWTALTGIAGATLWQVASMRVAALRNPADAKKLFLITSANFSARQIIPMFLGLAALAYILSGEMSPQGAGASGQMPVFLGGVIPSGLLGIVVAALLAAFMSTHDSYLLAWSSVITHDVVVPWRRMKGKETSEKARITLTRVLIFLIGLFILFFGLWYELESSIWNYLMLTGTIYFSGAFAVMVGGIYWKKASSTGAYWALAVGAAFPLIGLFVQKVITQIRLSDQVAGLLSFGGATAAMIVMSLLFPDKQPPRTEETEA